MENGELNKKLDKNLALNFKKCIIAANDRKSSF